MRDPNWNKIQDAIVRPDIDKHLVPLALYRGTRTFGGMHRNWNFAIAMMMAEVETTAEATLLSNNPDYSHLCGPVAKRQTTQIYSILSRLRDHPNVTDNIPGLTGYVRDFSLKHKFALTQVSLVDPTRRTNASWRIHADKGPRKSRILTPTADKSLVYPFVIHRPKNDDGAFDLMVEVNNAVSRGLPDHIRADICQDLIVAILSGEMDRSELKEEARYYTNKVLKMHPIKYGDMSFDEPIGDSGRALSEILTADAF